MRQPEPFQDHHRDDDDRNEPDDGRDKGRGAGELLEGVADDPRDERDDQHQDKELNHGPSIP